MSKTSVFVYGPAACGKSTNAAKLALHFGLSQVKDEWVHGQPFAATDCLILTRENLSQTTVWPRIYSFDEAMARSNVAVTKPTPQEQKGSAFLEVLGNRTPFDPDKPGNKTQPHVRLILEVARDIRKEWKNVNYAAKPYLEAMLTMTTSDKPYGCDAATDVIGRFLVNAGTFRGEAARKLKRELKDIAGIV